MASWKIRLDPADFDIELSSILESRKFFAVDDSTSTSGGALRRERAFVEHFRHNSNKNDSVSLWGQYCDEPTTDLESLSWNSNHFYTDPTTILTKPEAVEAIKESDIWFLLTDGEVFDHDVQRLAELALSKDVLNVPVIFLVVGSRGRTPETTDISVGISFFAASQDTLVLFMELETGRIFVIAGKGCFAPLRGNAAARSLSSWSELPVFANEMEFSKYCASRGIKVPKAESRMKLPKGVNLGPEWDWIHEAPTFVDVDLLLQAGILSDEDIMCLFAEEAFTYLAVTCKTMKKIPGLRSLVRAQKVEQVDPKLEDVSGASAIIARMGQAPNLEERTRLREELREAHTRNRAQYHDAVNNFAGSAKEQAIKKRNELVKSAIRMLASIEASSFDAEIVSRRSDRAREAELVEAETDIKTESLDLEGRSYKGFCVICYGEEEIMSICLKELNTEDNTADFALSYPLAAGTSAKNVSVIASQNICFQCALLSPNGMTVYKETLKAVIPVVNYTGANKKYIDTQLYRALTAGLATGEATIVQLFMAILDEVLRTKSWAGADLQDSQLSAGEQHESKQRRQTLKWMLDELITYSETANTFTGMSELATFQKALEWVAKDFDLRGLASFVVGYPSAGFAKLLSLGFRTGAFSIEALRRMRAAKMVHSVAAKYLGEMRKAAQSSDKSSQWKHQYLRMLYCDFNSPLVPKDMGGPKSLVTDVNSFLESASACLGHEETHMILFGSTNATETASRSHTSELGTIEDNEIMMHKTQLLLFWLLQEPKSHHTAQAFFKKLQYEEPLADSVLRPTLHVPVHELHSTLLSIFAWREDACPIDTHAAKLHIGVVPFTTPFGASVLHCGFESCREPFFDVNASSQAVVDVDAIRKARAQHFVNVYGIKSRSASSSGLPQPVRGGEPPNSTHVNLHIGVARTWAEQPRQKRRAILNDESEREGFVTSVRKRVCEQKRGDIYNKDIHQNVRDVLPSFFSVLGQALRLEGQSDEDITAYEHNFDNNNLDAKVRYELRASGLADG